MGNDDSQEQDDLDKIAKENLSLEPKDYVALAIATLETAFLPLLVLALILLAFVFLLR